VLSSFLHKRRARLFGRGGSPQSYGLILASTAPWRSRQSAFPHRFKSASPLTHILRNRSGAEDPLHHMGGSCCLGWAAAADLGFLPFPVDKMTLLTNHKVTAVSSNGVTEEGRSLKWRPGSGRTWMHCASWRD
jgi:hypothetical protein